MFLFTQSLRALRRAYTKESWHNGYVFVFLAWSFGMWPFGLLSLGLLIFWYFGIRAFWSFGLLVFLLFGLLIFCLLVF